MRPLAFISILTCLSILCACNNKLKTKPAKTDTTVAVKKPTHEWKITDWEYFGADTFVGHFTGRAKLDSIFLITMSHLTHCRIDSIPLYDSDWYSNIHLYDSLRVCQALCLKGADTIWLGCFVYCVIDMNEKALGKTHTLAIAADGKDFSNVGSCSIYKLYGRKWKQTLNFSIHQGFFTVPPGDTMRRFTEIPDFLEKRHGVYYYSDYGDDKDGYPQKWHKVSVK